MLDLITAPEDHVDLSKFSLAKYVPHTLLLARKILAAGKGQIICQWICSAHHALLVRGWQHVRHSALVQSSEDLAGFSHC